jgi:hypothetical protein
MISLNRILQESINEEKGSEVTNEFVKKYEEQPQVKKIKEKLKLTSTLTVYKPGTGVWTRGDRGKLKDPGTIRVTDWNQKPEWAKKVKPVTNFFEWLKTQPGVKQLGKTAGELGSEEPNRETLVYKNTFYALIPGEDNDARIAWGSTSRFKNPVWRKSDG